MPDTTNAYTSLITSQHRKPRFSALVRALTNPALEVQAMLETVRAAFALDDAVGTQLDATGLWVGRTRRLALPLEGVFFGWNEPDLGWQQAAWRGLYDSTTTMASLPDAVYRTLLRAKVVANTWDGTIPDAYRAWDTAFAGEGGVVLVQDNYDMSFTIALVGMDPDAVTTALLSSGYLPLKPEGVRIAGIVLTPPRLPAFGLEQYDEKIKGVDEGVWRDHERDGFEPLFAWNCDSEHLQGWRVGNWGIRLGNTLAGQAATGPIFAWNVESTGMRGWQEGVWDGRAQSNSGAADTSRWWGGRLLGDGVLRRAAFSFNAGANNGWVEAAWK